jgi:2-methylfumaryl-CoA isomerase
VKLWACRNERGTGTAIQFGYRLVLANNLAKRTERRRRRQGVAMSKMLSGMRVIEGSAFVAAPSGGMHLALLGADVIRFDPIGGSLDYTRWPLAPGGASLYWASLNKGKRSIQVDLRSGEGRDIVSGLICAPGDQGGMFLTNFPARGWLGYESMREHRDDVIMVTITGNPDGSTAVDYTVNAAVGYPMATGPSELAEPVNHVLPAWDVICGQQAALGLLAADRHRRTTGAGQLVTLALSDVAMSTVANMGHIAEAEILGEQRARLGNDLYGAFGRDFVTSDGHRFIVVAISIKQWKGMLEATGTTAQVHALEQELGVDFADEGERFTHRDRLFALVEGYAARTPMVQVAESLNTHGCCWGQYNDFLGMVENDVRCSTDNPMFQRVDQPGVGSVLSAGSPLRFSADDHVVVPPAPVLGANTDQVLEELLGLSTSEIAGLHDRKVVAGPA